ncbi:histidine phosphatase family protein [Altererythrobacter salegens]|uniref:Histidine phosphatase family protein n=1 Tax=Croceibacterium salegens TaxID=1737568 RepID=A0A6I4SZA1_9SPHN|nr:histidine phosphatase family protein [Croceibacterium salegens]MXO60106.1 histidine phosphatase family protein [Croceibacterium salegens]
MKHLGLLRHAKSDWDDLALRDFDRGLNNRGRRGAAAIGEHIRSFGWRCDMAIASPAERVRRTIEASGLDLEPRWDERLYLADAATLIAVLREIEGDPRRVLLVGHNPGLQELVFRLADPNVDDELLERAAEKFPTATLAVLECDIESWADLAPGCARLVHFARPRDLDPELGPERVG